MRDVEDPNLDDILNESSSSDAEKEELPAPIKAKDKIVDKKVAKDANRGSAPIQPFTSPTEESKANGPVLVDPNAMIYPTPKSDGAA